MIVAVIRVKCHNGHIVHDPTYRLHEVATCLNTDSPIIKSSTHSFSLRNWVIHQVTRPIIHVPKESLDYETTITWPKSFNFVLITNKSIKNVLYVIYIQDRHSLDINVFMLLGYVYLSNF